MSSRPTPPNRERELVYCHECHDEWYRDEHGLVCPNENCRSDFVEIIENNNDPRDDDDDMLPGLESVDFDDDEDLPGGMPRSGGATFFRFSGPSYSYTSSSRTFRGSPRRPGEEGSGHGLPQDQMMVDLFSTMFRNILGDHAVPHTPGGRPGGGGEGGDHRNAGDRGDGGPGFPFPGQFPRGGGDQQGPGPRDANSPQAGGAPPVVDIATLLASLFGADPDGLGGPPAVMMRMFGVPPGTGGDYVYSQSELDRVISQLMEQHQGNAPPPAPAEIIDSLPRVKTTEQMVNEGADCAVCKEDLFLDEEVTKLPCKHIYHFDCVSEWLKAHDTCPICRTPVTPEEQRQQQRQQQSQQSPNPGPGMLRWSLGLRPPGSSPPPGNMSNDSSSHSSGNNRPSGAGGATGSGNNASSNSNRRPSEGLNRNDISPQARSQYRDPAWDEVQNHI